MVDPARLRRLLERLAAETEELRRLASRSDAALLADHVMDGACPGRSSLARGRTRRDVDLIGHYSNRLETLQGLLRDCENLCSFR